MAVKCGGRASKLGLAHHLCASSHITKFAILGPKSRKFHRTHWDPAGKSVTKKKQIG